MASLHWQSGVHGIMVKLIHHQVTVTSVIKDRLKVETEFNQI